MLLARAAPCVHGACSFARAGLLVGAYGHGLESGERLEAVLQCTAAEAVSSSRDHLVICIVWRLQASKRRQEAKQRDGAATQRLLEAVSWVSAAAAAVAAPLTRAASGSQAFVGGA